LVSFGCLMNVANKKQLSKQLKKTEMKVKVPKKRESFSIVIANFWFLTTSLLPLFPFLSSVWSCFTIVNWMTHFYLKLKKHISHLISSLTYSVPNSNVEQKFLNSQLTHKYRGHDLRPPSKLCTNLLHCCQGITDTFNLFLKFFNSIGNQRIRLD
jgi:hypothetical protein